MAEADINFGQRFNRFMSGFSDRYEPYVRQHLSKVYMLLGSAAGFTAVGSLLQMQGFVDLGSLSAILSLLLVLGLHFYKDDGKNYYTRLGMFYSFGFCSGQSMGPLLSYICSLNPSIILTALVGTFVTFASLSIAALLAEQGKYLYLGGTLVSIINTMALLSFFNMFIKSYFVQMTQIYVGIAVMAAFILFDTQNIVEKCRAGNRDIVQHALDLFFDVMSMFRRLLIVLTQKEERKRNDRRKNQ